jgi:hypothetical protein
VLHEFDKAGKYRLRILDGKGSPVLDVREYIKCEKFEGFTRRGIRIHDEAEADALIAALQSFKSKEYVNGVASS